MVLSATDGTLKTLNGVTDDSLDMNSPNSLRYRIHRAIGYPRLIIVSGYVAVILVSIALGMNLQVWDSGGGVSVSQTLFLLSGLAIGVYTIHWGYADL